MKNTSQNTKITETSLALRQAHFLPLIYWLEVFPANLFQSLDSVADSTIRAVRYSLKSLGLLSKNGHAFYYLKTSRGFYLTTKEKHSIPSFPRLMSWGTTSNGKCLTARISESPRIGKECSLSDILEEHPDPKYFLSLEATQKILNNLTKAKVRGTEFTEQKESHPHKQAKRGG